MLTLPCAYITALLTFLDFLVYYISLDAKVLSVFYQFVPEPQNWPGVRGHTVNDNIRVYFLSRKANKLCWKQRVRSLAIVEGKIQNIVENKLEFPEEPVLCLFTSHAELHLDGRGADHSLIGDRATGPAVPQHVTSNWAQQFPLRLHSGTHEGPRTSHSHGLGVFSPCWGAWPGAAQPGQSGEWIAGTKWLPSPARNSRMAGKEVDELN